MTGRFVDHMPIDYFSRLGTSKVRLFRDALRTLQYIIEAILYYNPIKIFVLMCLFCIVLTLVFFVGALFTRMWLFVVFGVWAGLLALFIFAIGLLSVQLKQIMR
ncbi:MAG: glycosyltransferase family 2 protein, partial [Magnetococcales bacterium]|nr:glycosyltransferase family 2 protein [Magnetococcales bacterium]